MGQLRPNHSQRLSLNIDSHLVIDAGAGTGKTKTIVDRVIEHYLAEDQRATRLLPMPARPGRLAAGEMTEPMGERIDLRTWPGLIPTEVVVLTFTNLAAEELRHRLRRELANLRAGPTGTVDDERSDSRIPVDGLPEQLRTLLEDAPIGTIDSFLNRLVSPYRATLGERITRDQISDAERSLLQRAAVRGAWRLSSAPQRLGDTVDAGIPATEAEEFFAARGRLSHLHGRDGAQKVIGAMLGRALFVESSSRDLVGSSGRIDAALLRDAIVRDLDLAAVRNLLDRIEMTSRAWLCSHQDRAADLGVTPSESGSRAETLVDLLALGPCTSTWEGLRRILWYATAIGNCSKATTIGKGEFNPFPTGNLPNDSGWNRGHLTMTKGRIKDLNTFERAKENRDSAVAAAREVWQDPTVRPLLRYARIVGMLDGSPPPNAPAAWPMTSGPLPDPVPARSEALSGRCHLPLEREGEIIDDLLAVHRGTLQILQRLKAQRELHDFDDIGALAADLLLARCPDICRTLYSDDVIEALDSLPEQPWLDDHIDAALALSESALADSQWAEANPGKRAEDMVRDLSERVDRLRRIRRRFRAMIIDEAQDVNPRQWMLLSRLWGPRHRENDEAEVELEWEPTVCYVGDVKQSIYLFRQAQVTAFQHNIEHLRRINQDERTTHTELFRPPPLLDDDWSRDPRFDQTGFVRGTELRASVAASSGREVRFDADDAGVPAPTPDEISARLEGHIGLRVNYRTSGGLLRTMNEWWTDVFSPRHRAFPRGDWYADPTPLFAAPDLREREGRIEWLLPVRSEAEATPRDLTLPIDPFTHGAEDPMRMQNALIAARIRHLVEGRETRVRSADGEWTLADPGGEPVAPRDIMVLMPSRAMRDDLVERLQAVGVPGQADKEGTLLDRPAADALHALLQSAARPWHRHHVAWLARSPLIALSDSQLQSAIEPDVRGDLLRRLSSDPSLALPERQVAMIERWRAAIASGRATRLLEETIDESDLLVALPDAASRQDAERFCALVREMESDAGGDLVLLADRMRALQRAGRDSIEAETVPPSNAVRLMTIHGSKGLQSKVVIVASVFGSAQTDVHHEYQDRLVVTPRLFASHPKPWADKDDEPFSGIWEHGKQLHRAQVQAEARRLLYVAATRAEEHLIIAGAPRGCIWVEDGIEVVAEHGEMPSFGAMLLESMRQTSVRENDDESPWLHGGDAELLPSSNPLPTPKDLAFTLNPARLVRDAYLGQRGLNSIAIYHHPECFDASPPPTSPLVKMTHLDATARNLIADPPPTISASPRSDAPRIRISPHRLDLAAGCIRRHWLQRHIGLAGDAILHPGKAASAPSISVDGTGQEDSSESEAVDVSRGAESSGLPAPNDLGTIVHRALELGIRSPASRENQNAPIPAEWTAGQQSRLAGEEVDSLIEEVFEELLPADADPDATRAVVKEMLSRISDNDPAEGAEGVRTEWAFTFDDSVETENLQASRWTADGELATVNWSHARFRFSGIVDLVVATGEGEMREGSDGCLLPIDLKTEDAYLLVKPPSDPTGTLLEARPDDGTPTKAEHRMLEHHRLQLVLYARALQRLEDARRDAGLKWRTVLPPAVLIGVSGRLIQMTEEQRETAESDLDDLLKRIAEIEASDHDNPSNFPRLPAEQAATCRRCPYHIGALPICGPLDSVVGDSDDAAIDGALAPY